MSLSVQISNTRDYVNRLPEQKREVLTRLLDAIEASRNKEKTREDQSFTNGLIEALDIIMRTDKSVWIDGEKE